ncbi:MAG TPA: pilus assembly PilX N-terminal domain-containing protein [Porticoccaceae bacterium]|nr:pilus assembly PilX N-terminal domain-containing protein [Porticoccaceae bacterium]
MNIAAFPEGVARQRGAVLAVALIFLLLLSIVAISLMRSGQLEVLMAGNAQSQLGAFQLAEAVADSVLANWEDNLDTEDVVCSPDHPDPDSECTRSDLAWDDRLNPEEDDALPPVDDATVTARTKPLNDGKPGCVPPFVTGIAHGTWAFFFDVEASFDNTDERQGASQVNRGGVLVNPVSADCFSSPPEGDLDQYAHLRSS